MSQKVDHILPPFEMVLNADVKNINPGEIKNTIYWKAGYLVTQVNKKKDESGAYIRFKNRRQLESALKREWSEFGFKDATVELNTFFEENCFLHRLKLKHKKCYFEPIHPIKFPK